MEKVCNGRGSVSSERDAEGRLMIVVHDKGKPWHGVECSITRSDFAIGTAKVGYGDKVRFTIFQDDRGRYKLSDIWVELRDQANE